MSTQFTLPKWYDLHLHLRQEEFLSPLIAAQISGGCAGVLAMPNTKPPTAKVHESDPDPDSGHVWSIEAYKGMIEAAGGDHFQALIIPLYLTSATTPKMIEEGAKSGFLKAVKYYPPHGTTGAEHASAFQNFMENGVFEAMEEHGVVLCMHGEEHGLEGADYFDKNKNAEEFFYKERVPELLARYPALKIVGEHLTTAVACATIQAAGPRAAATVTPQHLLYTVADLLQGCRYHLYCLPLLKFEEDRAALRAAVTDPNNTQFFAGTDSAPHTKKATECGCAAGCYTGNIAPQLYAQAFEESGVNLDLSEGQEIFKRFLCTIGPGFYGLDIPKDTFTLTRAPQTVEMLETPAGPVTPLPLGMKQSEIPWRID